MSKDTKNSHQHPPLSSSFERSGNEDVLLSCSLVYKNKLTTVTNSSS